MLKLICMLLLYFFMFYSGNGKSPLIAVTLNSTRDSTIKDSVLTKADSIIEFAKKHLGSPYRFGSCSPQKGFDCSGFMYYIFKEYGVVLPRSSYEMGNSGTQVQLCECTKGDIILFRGTNAKNPRIGHAGVVISGPGEPVRFIHSSSNTKKGGVIISSYNESNYYSKRFVKVIRVLPAAQ